MTLEKLNYHLDTVIERLRQSNEMLNNINQRLSPREVPVPAHFDSTVKGSVWNSTTSGDPTPQYKS